MSYKTFVATTATMFASVVIGIMSLVVEPINVPLISVQSFADSQRQIACLANNVYYESGNQSVEGKLGVAYVTLNRSLSGKWPEDVCDVVYQKTQNTCQFSWVCERLRAPNNVLWEQSLAVARHVWYKYNPNEDPTLGATYFHATYVRPGWKHTKTVQLGDHIFYK